MLSTMEFDKIVRSPDTTRADAMVAYKAGEPLNYNPYEPDDPKHTYWAEGYEMAKNNPECNRVRNLNLSCQTCGG